MAANMEKNSKDKCKLQKKNQRELLKMKNTISEMGN